MPKLIVKIDLGDKPSLEELVREIAAARKDPVGTNSWFSLEDGDKILVDDALLHQSKADDSFVAFEFVGVCESDDRAELADIVRTATADGGTEDEILDRIDTIADERRGGSE